MWADCDLMQDHLDREQNTNLSPSRDEAVSESADTPPRCCAGAKVGPKPPIWHHVHQEATRQNVRDPYGRKQAPFCFGAYDTMGAALRRMHDLNTRSQQRGCPDRVRVAEWAVQDRCNPPAGTG